MLVYVVYLNQIETQFIEVCNHKLQYNTQTPDDIITLELHNVLILHNVFELMSALKTQLMTLPHSLSLQIK